MTLLPTPAFNTSVFLPTGELDENRAIDYVAALISRVRPGMEKEYGREWLETELQKGLREGLLTPAIYAVKAANAGDEICDAEHGRYWAVKRRVIRLILSPVKWALLALKVSGKSPAQTLWIPHSFAPPHSITSSASASSVAGTSRPNASAVCELITNSNLVACMIGRSAGFSPLRTRPV